MDVISKDPLVVTRARDPQRRTVVHQPHSLSKLQGDFERPANVVPLGQPTALVAYLSDFIVVDGAAPLLAQAALLDASPHARCGIARRYIDSGHPRGPLRFGHALRELIKDAQERRFRAVIVETLARLAPDLTSALQAAMLIMAEGVDIYEIAAGRLVIEPCLAVRIRAGLS